jgi:hypothetical protein
VKIAGGMFWSDHLKLLETVASSVDEMRMVPCSRAVGIREKKLLTGTVAMIPLNGILRGTKTTRRMRKYVPSLGNL